MRIGSRRLTPHGSLPNSALDRPTFDSRHQIAPDSLSMKTLVNDKTSDLHPIIRL